jgi:hypothetical protein
VGQTKEQAVQQAGSIYAHWLSTQAVEQVQEQAA